MPPGFVAAPGSATEQLQAITYLKEYERGLAAQQGLQLIPKSYGGEIYVRHASQCELLSPVGGELWRMPVALQCQSINQSIGTP